MTELLNKSKRLKMLLKKKILEMVQLQKFQTKEYAEELNIKVTQIKVK